MKQKNFLQHEIFQLQLKLILLSFHLIFKLSVGVCF